MLHIEICACDGNAIICWNCIAIASRQLLVYPGLRLLVFFGGGGGGSSKSGAILGVSKFEMVITLFKILKQNSFQYAIFGVWIFGQSIFWVFSLRHSIFWVLQIWPRKSIPMRELLVYSPWGPLHYSVTIHYWYRQSSAQRLRDDPLVHWSLLKRRPRSDWQSNASNKQYLIEHLSTP